MRDFGPRKPQRSLLDSAEFLSVRQALPSLYSETTSRCESQLDLSSPSKLSVRPLARAGYMGERSLSTYRSISISARKQTVESLLSYDNRSLNLGLSSEPELSPADFTSIEAARTKNQALHKRSKTVRVRVRQKLVEAHPEMGLLEELLVSFESAEASFADSRWFAASGRLPALACLHYLHDRFILLAQSLTQWHSQASSELLSLDAKSHSLESSVQQARLSALQAQSLQAELQQASRSKKDSEAYFQKHHRLWQAEKAQLENHLEMLSEQLAKLQGEGSTAALSARLQEQERFRDELAREFQAFKLHEKTAKTRLVQELGALREEMKEKKEAFAHFLREKAEFEAILASKDFETARKTEQVREAREGAAMLGEETRKLVEYKEKFERLSVLHEELKRTIVKLETSIKTGNFAGVGAEMIVSLDDPLFRKIRENPSQISNNSRLSTSKPKRSDPDQTLDPAHFSYLRPTFAALLQDTLPDATTQAQYEPPFGNWLETTIRGILDSKWYEHLGCMEEMGRKPSRMADFVYGWTGHFMIDENTRQIRPLERWQKESADHLRLTLLLGVKHEMAKRIWEISTFREFLLEELTIDELSFFLHCRFLLFEGPQLSQSLGRVKHLHYVSLLKAREVVDTVMSKLPDKLLGDVRALLSEHTRNKHDELQIESSLVLRVLLEYYRKEKVAKCKGLKQLFVEAEAAESGVDFFGFRSIVENVKWDISEVQIAAFYRDCWTAGCGVIDFPTFLLVSNEHCFFLKSLRLKGLHKEPPLGADNLIAKRESPSAELMSRVYELWQTNSASLALLKEGITQMGQPELLHTLVKLEGYIKKKGQAPPEEYNGWSIYEAMRHIWVMLLRLDLSFGEYNALVRPILSSAEDYSSGAMVVQVEALVKAAGLFARKVNALKVERFTLAAAARRIQRRWRQAKAEKSPQADKSPLPRNRGRKPTRS